MTKWVQVIDPNTNLPVFEGNPPVPKYEIDPRTGDKKEYIILFTKHDEGKYYFYDINCDNIIKFFNLYFTPRVMEFAAQTSPILFSKRFPSLVIFSLKRAKHYEESKKYLDKIWPKVNKKVKLFVSDILEGMSVKLSEFCGVREDGLPKAYIIDL